MAENSFIKYLFTNPVGNTKANTWNVLPAVLTTWSNLLANKGNKTSYELYREQARNYIDTAKKNAELIENQGEIALRNLRYKNKLERGNDVVRVAAGNGNMSGSNLDLLVRKERIRKMNEQTINANFTNQAMMELSNGYRNAAHTYGTLAAKAGADKYSAIASFLKGIETYVGLQVRDAKIESATKNQKEQAVYSADAERQYTNKKYGISDVEINVVTPSTNLNNIIESDNQPTLLKAIDQEIKRDSIDIDDIKFSY